MSVINTIYFDMDGVLADLEHYFETKYGNSSFHYRDTHGYDGLAEYFKEHVHTYDMFSDLRPMRDHTHGRNILENLLEYGYEVKILSCASHIFLGEDVGDAIVEQKLKWLCKHGFDDYGIEYIFTRDHSSKSAHANINSLLIDDSLSSVEPFRDAGGWVVHHKNFKETHDLLDMVLNKWGEHHATRKIKSAV